MSTKTIHLVIRDGHFIVVYLRKSGFRATYGTYTKTDRGDYEASYGIKKLYSKSFSGLKQKIRTFARALGHDEIVN